MFTSERKACGVFTSLIVFLLVIIINHAITTNRWWRLLIIRFRVCAFGYSVYKNENNTFSHGDNLHLRPGFMEWNDISSGAQWITERSLLQHHDDVKIPVCVTPLMLTVYWYYRNILVSEHFPHDLFVWIPCIARYLQVHPCLLVALAGSFNCHYLQWIWAS